MANAVRPLREITPTTDTRKTGKVTSMRQLTLKPRGMSTTIVSVSVDILNTRRDFNR